VTAILYIYGIAEGEPAGPLGEGIGDEPLVLIPAGGLGAVA